MEICALQVGWFFIIFEMFTSNQVVVVVVFVVVV